MHLGEGIAFGSLVLGFLGFVLKLTSDEAAKRSRIYERIDEIKKDTAQKIDDTTKNVEMKLQSKEICNIHTTTIDETLQEIRADVKTLLKNKDRQ